MVASLINEVSLCLSFCLSSFLLSACVRTLRGHSASKPCLLLLTLCFFDFPLQPHGSCSLNKWVAGFRDEYQWSACRSVPAAMCIFWYVFVCWNGLKGRPCVFVVDLLMISCRAHYQAERKLHMTQLQLVQFMQFVSALVSFSCLLRASYLMTKHKILFTSLYFDYILQNVFYIQKKWTL